MASKQVIYTDRITNIAVQGGMVRIDLAVMAGTAKGKDDKPAIRLEPTHQLVMPLDAFVSSFRTQEKLMAELIARDKQQREAAAQPAVEAPATA